MGRMGVTSEAVQLAGWPEIIKHKDTSIEMTALLEVRDLHASVGDKPILKGINLTLNAGEVHAIMGPNGSGKSTMSYVLAGRDGYEITGGDVLINGESVVSELWRRLNCLASAASARWPGRMR